MQQSGAPALTQATQEEETDAADNLQYTDAYQRLDSQENIQSSEG